MGYLLSYSRLEPTEGTLPERLLLLRDGDIGWEGLEGVILDAKAAKKIIKEFQQHGAKVPIDWEHATVKVGEDRTDKAPAAGWIESLEYVEGEGLYGTVSWTATAAAELKERAYKYISPVILTDKETKAIEVLHSVALTNTPRTINAPELLAAASRFMDEFNKKGTKMEKTITVGDKTHLRMILAQDEELPQFPAISDDQQAISRLLDALNAKDAGLAEDATLAEVINAAIEMLEGGEGEGEGEGEAEAEVASKKLADQLGLEVGSKLAAVSTEVDKLMLQAGMVPELTKRLAVLEGERTTARVDLLIDKALKDNRLNPNDEKQMATARRLAASDESAFVGIVGSLTPYAPAGQLVDPEGSAAGSRAKIIQAATKEYDADKNVACGAAKETYVNVALGEDGLAELSEAELATVKGGK